MLRAAEKISDLIFSPGRPPQVQVYGQMIPVQVPGLTFLTPDDTRHIAADLIGDNKQAINTLREHGACDISFGMPGMARFRVNIFIQRGSCAVVMRVIPTTIPDFAALRLPQQLSEVTKLQGRNCPGDWSCGLGEIVDSGGADRQSSTAKSTTTSSPSKIPLSFCIIISAPPFISENCTAIRPALPTLCVRPCVRPRKSFSSGRCAIARPSK